MYFIFKFLLYLVLRCEIVRSKWTSLCFIFWTFRLICRGSDWVVCMSPVIRLAWSNTLESNNNTLLSNILQQPADNSLNSKRNICFQERCNLDFHLNYWEESFFDKTKCNNCSLLLFSASLIFVWKQGSLCKVWIMHWEIEIRWFISSLNTSITSLHAVCQIFLLNYIVSILHSRCLSFTNLAWAYLYE